MQKRKPITRPVALLLILMLICQIFIGAAPEQDTDQSPNDKTNLQDDEYIVIEEETENPVPLADPENIIETKSQSQTESVQYTNGTSTQTGTFEEMYTLASRNNGGTVTLLSNISATEENGFGSDESIFLNHGILVNKNRDITIDFNGFEIDMSAVTGTKSYKFATVTDTTSSLTLKGPGGIVNYNNPNGTLIYNQGTLTLSKDFYIKSSNCNTIINTSKDSAVTLEDTTLTDNTVTNASIDLAGKLYINGTVTIKDTNKKGVALKNDSSVTPDIIIANTAGKSSRVQITTPFGAGQAIGPKTSLFSENSQVNILDATNQSCIVTNMSEGMVCHHTSPAQATFDNIKMPFADTWNITDQFENADITLLQDVQATTSNNAVQSSFGNGPSIDGGHVLVLKSNKTVNLDMNGHTLDKNNTNNTDENMTGMIFRVDENAELNISDGTIQGGNGTVAGAIYNKGTVNLQNVTIQNNKATTGGAITNTQSGTLNLNETNILKNNNNEPKGGAGVINNGSMTLTDSSVSENKNGGIYNKGNLSTGGNTSIYNNQAKAGIEMNLDTDEGTFTISSPIKGSNALIGITTQKKTITTASTLSDQEHFSIDNRSDLHVIYNSTTNTLDITSASTDISANEAALLNSSSVTMAEGNFIDMCSLANTTPGSTVKVLKDISLTNLSTHIICDTNDYTIDLNRKTITLQNNTSLSQIFLIQNKTLTVTDEGTATTTSTELETLPDTIADSSTTMGTTLTNWIKKNAGADNNTKTLTYYSTEMGTARPVHKKNVLNYTRMGAIISSSGPTCLFYVNSNGKLNINGGMYQNASNKIITVMEDASTKGAVIENAVMTNATCAVSANTSVDILSSKIIGVSNFSDYSTYKHTINTAATATLTMKDSLVANCYQLNSPPIKLLGPCLIEDSVFTHNKNNNTHGVIHLQPQTTTANQVIRNTDIAGNYARSGSGSIYVDQSDSNLTLDGIKSFANYAVNGPGVYYEPTDGSTTSGIIKNSELCWNYATSAGGGLYEKGRGLDVSDTRIHHNKASVSRGGVMLYNIPEKLTFTNVEIYNNTGRGTSGGMLILNVTNMTANNLNLHDNRQTNAAQDSTTTVGGIWCEDSTLTINKGSITNNFANAGKGGALTVMNSTVNLNNTEITDNKSNIYPGLYYDIASRISVKGAVLIENNTTNNESAQVNAVMEYGNAMTINEVLDAGSKIKVTVNNVPSSVTKIPVANGDHASGTAPNFVPDDPKYTSHEQNGAVWFTEESEIQDGEFDGVMVQYYINLQQPVIYDPDSPSLKIINMIKGALPQNSDENGIEPSYIHIDESTGQIKMTTELTPMYKSRIIPVNRVTSINAINRFTELDRKGWNLAEIWVKKKDAQQDSTDRNDWDIYQYEEPFDISKLNIQNHSVIRLVCDSIESETDYACNFFDYDITDGYWYKTKTDAQNRTNPQPMSTLNHNTEHYVNTINQGINSTKNITTSGTVNYQFGNSNHGTSHSEDYVPAVAGDASSRKYYFNMFNRDKTLSIATFEGCYFGMVNAYDANDGLNWSYAKMNAPELFTDKDQVGKTKYNNGEYSLNFHRNGSTYTLQRVNGAGSHAQNLMTMEHPVTNGKPYTNIWTNNFWPMDESASAGTDGHDPLEGHEVTHGNTRTAVGYQYPTSDDGQYHNAFFGMSTEIKFKLTEDYVAPLKYYFFGDDDLWVFLDGQLIVDIGGVHRSVGAYVDIREYIEEGDTSQHTMKIFYTERGASGSTCWMQFTMPATVTDADHDVHMFHKISNLGHDVQGAVFSLYSDPECKNEISNHVSNLTGNVFVTNLTPTETYYMKETSAPEGYKKSNTIYKLVKVGDTWHMSDLSDPTNASVTDVVNEEDTGGPILPDTGGPGPLPYYVVSLATIVIIPISVMKRRKRKRTT